MPAEPPAQGPPLRLDLENGWVWRGPQPCKLTPTTFAVLRYLMEHAGRLVTKQELLRAAWPDATVSAWALITCMRRLRQVLGDQAKAPQFIETVPRRGYRFIGPVIMADAATPVPPGFSPPRSLPPALPPTPLVGRDAELAQLHAWFERALQGSRQVVFVTGEPGIGKTTVVDAFLDQVATTGQVWIGRGQCIAHYGAGEAYMPVLEALGRLGRQPDGARLGAFLGQHAPAWLVQLPALCRVAEMEPHQRTVLGATQDRMLREMAEALDVLTMEQGLVLSLEDLQWSDASTLALLAMLARRQEPARLLVVGTYRLIDVLLGAHPLREVQQELQLHGHCQDLRLGLLSEPAVGGYLAQRFAGGAHLPLQELARALYQRTEGHPLFTVSVVEEWVTQGLIRWHHGQWALDGDLHTVEVPTTIRQFIVRQMERVNVAERTVLDVASVAGGKFATAVVAASLGSAIEDVERCCEDLVQRHQFLQRGGIVAWPDGTLASRYRFVHMLYRDVVYDLVSAARRVALHRQIGVRQEQGYGERASEIAAELAMHFEYGRDNERAVHYLGHAAQNASQRSAHREVLTHVTRGLMLLQRLPDTPARARHELRLQLTLAPTLVATQGPAAPEVETAYSRARTLGQQVGEMVEFCTALDGLVIFYSIKAQYQTVLELGEDLLRLAQHGPDLTPLVLAHRALASTWFYLGEFARARTHAEQGMALDAPQSQPSLAVRQGHDLGVSYLWYAACALWSLGYPDQARQRLDAMLTRAQGLHPYSLATAATFAAIFHQFCRHWPLTQERAEQAVALSTAQGFPFWLGHSMVLRGWVLAAQGHSAEGIAQIRQGIATWRATRAEITRPYALALLAEACGNAGRADEGLSLLAEALAVAHQHGERYYEAEMHRLTGELLLVQETTGARVSEAEACFWQAIDLARQQQAKSRVLRAVMVS